MGSEELWPIRVTVRTPSLFSVKTTRAGPDWLLPGPGAGAGACKPPITVAVDWLSYAAPSGPEAVPKLLINCLIINIYLAAAAFPGTSRSGATILVALILGLNRVAATEFTFLVGIPTMLAAGAWKIFKALSTS